MPSALTLAEDGRSGFSLVVAADAPRPVRFAAEELRRYLAAICGAQLPLSTDAADGPAIYVGTPGPLAADAPSALRGRGDDGYLVRTVGPHLVLLGNSPRATLYAVYHFLESQLGCGWCAPGDDTVPRRSTIRIPRLNEALGPPALAMRQLILYPYGGEWLTTNNLPHTDWLAKNRLNWAHPAPNGPYSWERNRSRHTLVPEVARRGLRLEVGGHTFNTWLPPDRYAADHPGYYALAADGTRAADGTHIAGLCLSHPDVPARVADHIVQWLDANPEADAVDLWHNDSFTACRCPRCTPPDAQPSPAAAYTRTYIRFANTVAGLVARHHPRVLVNLLAYAHTTDCPPDAEPLADNVLVGLCLYPRPSQRTMRPLETSPQKLDRNFRRQIPAWQQRAEHFYIYEYYTFSAKQKVWSMVSTIREDIRFFVRSGIQGISSDQWGPGWYPLNMYAYARLAWDPELETDAIVADFCSRHYGGARHAMTDYWTLLEHALRESWNTDTPADWRDRDRLALIRRALAEADSEAIAARIRATAALHPTEPAP